MSDPILLHGPDGSKLQFTGGVTAMDEGLENYVFISLFTGLGWCGNVLLQEPIGSDFEAICNQPITRAALNDIRLAAERALSGRVLGKVNVTVSNPQSNRLLLTVNPAGLVLSRENGRWYFQGRTNPPPGVVSTQQVVTFGGQQVTFNGNDGVW